jgi:hypothetical protein
MEETTKNVYPNSGINNQNQSSNKSNQETEDRQNFNYYDFYSEEKPNQVDEDLEKVVAKNYENPEDYRLFYENKEDDDLQDEQLYDNNDEVDEKDQSEKDFYDLEKEKEYERVKGILDN